MNSGGPSPPSGSGTLRRNNAPGQWRIKSRRHLPGRSPDAGIAAVMGFSGATACHRYQPSGDSEVLFLRSRGAPCNKMCKSVHRTLMVRSGWGRGRNSPAQPGVALNAVPRWSSLCRVSAGYVTNSLCTPCDAKFPRTGPMVDGEADASPSGGMALDTGSSPVREPSPHRCGWRGVTPSDSFFCS
jgi:hypothetical protein